jgi:hypothetical protein
MRSSSRVAASHIEANHVARNGEYGCVILLTRSVGVRRLLKSCGGGLSNETNPNELLVPLRELAGFQQDRATKNMIRHRQRVRFT